MKRSLKFDDENLGMIQMPGEDWRRIRPEQARQAGRSNQSLRAGPEEMSGDMIAGVVRSGRRTSTSGGHHRRLRAVTPFRWEVEGIRMAARTTIHRMVKMTENMTMGR